jgi:periplasmic protein TonB
VSETIVLDELLRQREGLQPARDRLFAALLLTSALHALVILGVSFHRFVAGRSGSVSTLEVLLLQPPDRTQEDNARADYLSQVNQRGAGTSRDARTTQRPPWDRGEDGEDAPTHDDDAASDTSAAATDIVSSGRGPQIANSATSRAATSGVSPLPVFSETPPRPRNSADLGDLLALRGENRGLAPDANTRASEIAVYLEAWRHKIERIGTNNYPLTAAHRDGLSGNPILDVEILADGRLGQVIVQRSSGFPQLDQAALGILRLAAPFDPFPKALAQQHRSIRTSYEWQFIGGALQDSTLRNTSGTQ